MHAVQAYLEGVWGEAAARFRLLAENTRTGSDQERTVTAPLRMSFDVACSAEHAFQRVDRRRIGTWWPP